MTTIIVIEKNGTVKEKTVKNMDKIYSFCNYRSDKNFLNLNTWKLESYSYKLYGKKTGNSGSENKFDLPPPVDSDLFFGNLCVIKYDKDNKVESFDLDQWNKFYETLFGGFESLDEEEERSVDSESYEEEELTKEGYLKDGFVVDDDGLKEEEYVDISSEEEDD